MVVSPYPPYAVSASLEGLDEPRLIEDVGAALRIGRIAMPTLRDFGLRLVRVKISALAGTTVQVMIERPDGTMTIDDCERVSIALSPVFDFEDIMTRAYRLEISSPGIDRPLVRESDFERAVGHEARVEMTVPINGRKRFRGHIEAVSAGPGGPVARLLLVADDKSKASVELPIGAMSEARLVLTDDLIRAALRREKAALKEARRAGARPGAEARTKAQANSKRKAAARGAVKEPLGPDEGDPNGR